MGQHSVQAKKQILRLSANPSNVRLFIDRVNVQGSLRALILHAR